MDCPKCVELFLRTEIEPFGIGQMIQSGDSHICNVCDYEIEKLPDNKIDSLESEFINGNPGYTGTPDLIDRITSLLWQVENREQLQMFHDLLYEAITYWEIKDLHKFNNIKRLFFDCHQ